jgi:hypothetical protein
VVLAANDMPTINDITYEELVQVVSKVSFLIIQLDARFRLKVLSKSICNVHLTQNDITLVEPPCLSVCSFLALAIVKWQC